MTRNHLDQQKLRRTFLERWLSPGSHLLTKSWMTASTTQCPSWTPPKARGPLWLTGSSITSSQSATSCKGGCITLESMPKMIWASLHLRSPQPGGWRRRKVIFYISNNLKEQKTHIITMFLSCSAERFVTSTPARKDRDLQCPPVFIVPLKLHNVPKGYECYMSCAVTGNPKPRITWYRNHISLNTDTNYYISNTCGVCSLLILRVGPKDMGEYTIVAENTLGRAESSTILSVRGENMQQSNSSSRCIWIPLMITTPLPQTEWRCWRQHNLSRRSIQKSGCKDTESVLKLNQNVPLIKHRTETHKFTMTEPTLSSVFLSNNKNK